MSNIPEAIDEMLAEAVDETNCSFISMNLARKSGIEGDISGRIISYGTEFTFFPVKQIATAMFGAYVSDFTVGRINFDSFYSTMKERLELYHESSFWNGKCILLSSVFKIKGLDVFVVMEDMEEIGRCSQQNGKEFEKSNAGILTLIYPLNIKGQLLELVKEFQNFIITENRGEPRTIYMVADKGNGLSIVRFDIPDREYGKLALNYGDKFLNVHQRLGEFLDNDDTGLVLLHGEPGTGKTFYIRSLIANVHKRVIYIPTNMMSAISSPGFISFMQSNSGCILIIEDAEDVLRPREETGNSVAVSNLLNITDGILGDVLKMKVICTFNTDINKIDSALLRKGRLALDYEFKKLSVIESNNLLKSLGKNHITKTEMTLTEIYNIDVNNMHVEKVRQSIGFNK